MPRQCSICSHPDRTAIDKEIVAGTAFRVIAQRFAVSSDSLQRHKVGHLADLLTRAAVVEQERGVELVTQQREQSAAQDAVALDVMSKLRLIFDRAEKMLAACDEWLTDPNDLTRYDLSPRAHEINVIYEDVLYDDEGNGHTKKGKARLSDLLTIAREPTPDRAFTLVETKTADPRKLLLNTVAELRPMIELLAKLVGELDERPVNLIMMPEWVAVRTAIISALSPYPDAYQAFVDQMRSLAAGGETA